MSAGPEPIGDLVAVTCVVEASLLLASQWSRILIEYVYPLLKRLNELHPSHQFRLSFVTYGAADTRPQPLLFKGYFAPLAQVMKELREEPSKLGIGLISGSARGLSALEGLVAAIELFDILMASANFNVNHAPTQSPQKDNRSLVSHLLHIAASQPDNAQRPQHNTLHHLDFVNWDSIPAELRKRKINLSLISLKKIPPFQDLQSSVAGPGVQSPWFNVHAPHVLLLAGFPTPQKMGTKRLPDALPSDQSPEPKRQKVAADPASKTASPALPPARIVQNQRSQQQATPQPPSMIIPAPNSSPAQQPSQPPASVPASTPTTASPAPPPPSGPPSVSTLGTEVLDQVVAQPKFSQMLERFKGLKKDIQILDGRIVDAQSAGQMGVLIELQKERGQKVKIRDQIETPLKQYYHKILLAKETSIAQANAAASAVPNASAGAGSSTQPVYPPNVPSASSERPMGQTPDEHKPVVLDTQALAHSRQSRDGTIPAPKGGDPQAGPSQAQTHPTLTPEVAAQMQKLLEKKGIRPPSLGPPSQTSGMTSQDAAVTSNPTNNQVVQSFNTSAWLGTFSGIFPGQRTELQVLVAGVFSTIPSEMHTEIRTDLWPKKLTLELCKEPMRDNTELSSWFKRHQTRTRLMQFRAYPRASDAAMNERTFQKVKEIMTERRIFAYAGWQLPSGKFSYNILIFPVPQGFAGAVFPDGLPDLPGSGNVLGVQPRAEETKPQPSSGGVSLPPALLARMRGLDPARQKQFLMEFFRLRQKQLQQSQQAHGTSGQAMNPFGMSIPPNYGAVANIPSGLHMNMDVPTVNAGAYNTEGGTVNYEMMQSFMHRNADGSTSQGMGSSSMP